MKNDDKRRLAFQAALIQNCSMMIMAPRRKGYLGYQQYESSTGPYFPLGDKEMKVAVVIP